MKKPALPGKTFIEAGSTLLFALFAEKTTAAAEPINGFEGLLDPDIRPPFRKGGWFGQTAMPAVHQAM